MYTMVRKAARRTARRGKQRGRRRYKGGVGEGKRYNRSSKAMRDDRYNPDARIDYGAASGEMLNIGAQMRKQAMTEMGKGLASARDAAGARLSAAGQRLNTTRRNMHKHAFEDNNGGLYGRTGTRLASARDAAREGLGAAGTAIGNVANKTRRKFSNWRRNSNARNLARQTIRGKSLFDQPQRSPDPVRPAAVAAAVPAATAAESGEMQSVLCQVAREKLQMDLPGDECIGKENPLINEQRKNLLALAAYQGDRGTVTVKDIWNVAVNQDYITNADSTYHVDANLGGESAPNPPPEPQSRALARESLRRRRQADADTPTSPRPQTRTSRRPSKQRRFTTPTSPQPQTRTSRRRNRRAPPPLPTISEQEQEQGDPPITSVRGLFSQQPERETRQQAKKRFLEEKRKCEEKDGQGRQKGVFVKNKCISPAAVPEGIHVPGWDPRQPIKRNLKGWQK